MKRQINLVVAIAVALVSIGISPAYAVDERVIDIVSVTWAGAKAPVADVNEVAKIVNTQVNSDWQKFTTLYGDTSDRTISFVAGKVLAAPIVLNSRMPCSGTQGAEFMSSIQPEAFKRLGFSDYTRRYLLVVSPNAGCIWSGRAELGGSRSTNGVLILHDSASSFVISHELGHTFGLGHTNFLRCDDGSFDGPWGSGCKAVEYGGTIDVMGNVSTTSPLSTYHQWRMGLLSDSQVKQVWGSEVVTLAPSDFAAGLRALFIRDGKSSYWIEYRRSLEGSGYKPGLAIYRLDAPPASAVVSPNSDDTITEFDTTLGTDVWMLNLDTYKYKDSRAVSGSMTALTATTHSGNISLSAVASATSAVVTITRRADVTPPPTPEVVASAQWISPGMSIIKDGYDDGESAVEGFEALVDGVVQKISVSDVKDWKPTYLSPFTPTKTVYLNDLPEGSYSFSLRAIDKAGNKSSWSTAQDVVIDRADPVVTNDFLVTSADKNLVTVGWKGAVDTGSGICAVNLVDEDGWVLQSSSTKNSPSLIFATNEKTVATAQILDCVGNGLSADFTATSSFISADKSSKTGKWSAATNYGAGAVKCVGKCTLSITARGKNSVIVGAGSASVTVGNKTIATIADSKAAKSRVGASIDLGATKRVVRISGSNFIIVGLASVTTTLGELTEFERSPSTPDASLELTTQKVLSQFGFRASDFSHEWSVLPMDGGTTLRDPSLDLCGATYASEVNRKERRQLTAEKSNSSFVFLSTEVVRYSSAAAASAAQKELAAVLTKCQADKGYRDTTGTLMPYTFKALSMLPSGLQPSDSRVLVYTDIDSGDRKRTLLGIYQFSGELFTGLYVMNSQGFTDAQVAKWLKVAEVMAQRLQGRAI